MLFKLYIYDAQYMDNCLFDNFEEFTEQVIPLNIRYIYKNFSKELIYIKRDFRLHNHMY